jgi:hypothetical protein
MIASTALTSGWQGSYCYRSVDSASYTLMQHQQINSLQTTWHSKDVSSCMAGYKPVLSMGSERRVFVHGGLQTCFIYGVWKTCLRAWRATNLFYLWGLKDRVRPSTVLIARKRCIKLQNCVLLFVLPPFCSATLLFRPWHETACHLFGGQLLHHCT